MAKKFTLDSFKEAINIDSGLKSSLLNETDVFDEENGVALVHQNNITKYLERYMCKTEEELQDYLYYNKGIFLKVI